MSGKQSRKIRKTKSFSKKAVAGAAAAILCAAPLAAESGEFLVSVYPHFSFPVVKFDDSLATGFGGGLRLTYRPTEYFGVFVQGDYKQFTFDTKQNIGNLSVIDGTVGAGYHLPLTDRLGLDLDAGVGFYSSSYQKGTGSNSTPIKLNGFNVGGSISVSYKIGPAISVYASGGAQHYAYKNSKFLTTIDANPGVTFNVTKFFSSKNNVSVGEQTLKPVFPVFYSWYNDNPFGTVEICNEEDASITDVTVYFYQQQYMGQPRDCGKTAVLKKGEKLTVDLKAFFNENMLNLNEKSDTMASIIVEYKYLGSKRSATFPMIVPVYGRNNMSWEDDRCASAFVSSKDPAAMWFAKYVASTVREDIRSGVPQNIQYAMAVFKALDEFGINYVKDPTSAFEDNVGTASIDFLQFPYQTLMYRGGDCDDLSILVCSLFESLGIKTAFITIPGHIYMAFDSGFTLEQAKEYFVSLDDFIVDGNQVWVPLEITLSDEGFNKAWHKGAWEWNTANRSGNAMLYKMEDSWKVYKPVSVPGATSKFTLPDESLVAKGFSATVDEFVLNQITPQIASFENLLVKAPTAQNYNDFGVLYARYGLFEQAEDQFRIARTTKYLPAILNSANLYYSQKEYIKAASWYKQVLAADKNNNLAMLGLARCAYETGDYTECDRWYGTVYKNDRALAKQYSYLGAFEQTSGRSFSLADRLENTVWLQSGDFGSFKNDIKPQTTTAYASNIVSGERVMLQTGDSIPESSSLGLSSSSVAIVPTSIKEERRDEEQGTSGSAGDGDDDDEYKGISSQLDFNILSAQDLADLAADSIIQNGETLDDFDASAFTLSVKEDKLIDNTYVTSLMTDVPVKEAAVKEEEAKEEIALPEVDITVAETKVVKAAAVVKETVVAKETQTVDTALREPQGPQGLQAETKGLQDETQTSDWVDELIDGLKELEEKQEVSTLRQTQDGAVSTTTTDSSTTTTDSSTTTTVVVPEPVEGPQTTNKKSNIKYIGFAAIAAAIAAFVIAKRRKDKKDE